jgi:mono/diheme cytochrome c family protein
MRIFRFVAAICSGVLVATFVFLCAFLRSQGLSARKKPSNVEYAVANFALGLSIPAEAKKLNNTLTADTQVLAEARKYYKAHCAICHADDGAGETALAAGLSPEVPDLRAGYIQKLTDGEIFYVIKNAVRFTGMPGWGLQDKDNWNLVALVRQFAKDSRNPNKQMWLTTILMPLSF